LKNAVTFSPKAENAAGTRKAGPALIAEDFVSLRWEVELSVGRTLGMLGIAGLVSCE
jgi:hypothetical protein